MAIINYQVTANHHTTHGMNSQVLDASVWSMREDGYLFEYCLCSACHPLSDVVCGLIVVFAFNNDC